MGKKLVQFMNMIKLPIDYNLKKKNVNGEKIGIFL